MKFLKVIRITIIMISIMIAYLIYSSEYNIKPELNQLETSIEEFLEENVTVIDYIKVDNTLSVYYTMRSNDIIGFTTLYKGINSRYQIRNASFNIRNRVLQGEPFKTNRGDYLAIIGTNYDDKISKIRIKTNSGEMFSENVHDKSEILTVFGVDSHTQLETYQLYDKDNNDITEEMNRYITTKESSSTGKGKAEFFMMYVLCFTTILAGYGISRLFINRDSRSVI